MEDDERFAHIAKDPRFKKIPVEKRKVKIDKRFRQMFTDEDFNTKYFVDKRGRKVKESAKEDLRNFYELSDEEEKDLEKDDEKIQRASDEASEDESENEKRKEKKRSKTKRKKKGKKEIAEDEEVEREREVSLSIDNEENHIIDNNNDIWQGLGEDAPITEEATRRLALCNMDWDKITADDLFVLFHSFLPSGKSIISVRIYPSEYGVERMKREDEVGPTELVSNGNENESQDENKDNEYDQEKLRQYQLNRLKYYYAVVECDSPVTAETIYEECDGLEYEASSSHLDLRFIPDDMTFDSEPTSQATVLPSAETYKPSEFITTALQQSNVKLTWDESDPKRVQTTMRNFSKDDLLDMDFKAYLASSSSEELSDGEDENKKENEDTKIEKYKELLEEIQKKDHESENEMEVTWEVGLKETTEELVKRKKNENEQKKLTPWENYLNEKKNKKKSKKKLKENDKETAQISDDELPADVNLNDPFFAEELENTNIETKNANKTRKRKGVQEESEEDKRRKAELQLLMMEEDDGKKHFNLKSIMKNEKNKKRKNKRKSEAQKEDGFEIDVNDARFSALYSSHHYAVDPSDPQFKKTKAMGSIINEKQRRLEKTGGNTGEPAVAMETSEKQKKVDPALSVLVKNIKSNAIKYQDKKKRKK